MSDDIFEYVSKFSDDIYEGLNKFKDKDALVDFITKHGDNGAKVAAKGGDDLVKAVKNLDDSAADSFFQMWRDFKI